MANFLRPEHDTKRTIENKAKENFANFIYEVFDYIKGNWVCRYIAILINKISLMAGLLLRRPRRGGIIIKKKELEILFNNSSYFFFRLKFNSAMSFKSFGLALISLSLIKSSKLIYKISISFSLTISLSL